MSSGRLTLLKGGPADGKVCETSSAVPCFLLTVPRDQSLLDKPERTAIWNERRMWYEDREELRRREADGT